MRGNWQTITAAGAPTPRYSPAVTWSGSHLLVFGGSGCGFSTTASAAAFDPLGGTWSDIGCTVPSGDRANGVAFMDGGYMRHWLGNGGDTPAGLQYETSTGTWSAWALPTGTPSMLTDGVPADDGRRLYFIRDTTGSCGPASVVSYDRVTGAWLPEDTSAAPAGLMTGYQGAVPVWAGSEVIAWGGRCAGSGAGPSGVGGRYQPPAIP